MMVSSLYNSTLSHHLETMAPYDARDEDDIQDILSSFYFIDSSSDSDKELPDDDAESNQYRSDEEEEDIELYELYGNEDEDDNENDRYSLSSHESDESDPDYPPDPPTDDYLPVFQESCQQELRHDPIDAYHDATYRNSKTENVSLSIADLEEPPRGRPLQKKILGWPSSGHGLSSTGLSS